METKKESKLRIWYLSHKDLLWEIFRFLLVGGLATIADWLVSFIVSAITPEIMISSWNVKDTLATICGFVVGLIINYILSIVFVYKNKKDENSGKSVKDFILFTVIGVIVLLFQILFIYLLNDLLFNKVLCWNTVLIENLTYGYILSRVLATAIGLVLNYLARKKFIFK